jgi:hypothetical protein
MLIGASKRRVQATCKEPSKAGDLVSSRKQVRVTLIVPNIRIASLISFKPTSSLTLASALPFL